MKHGLKSFLRIAAPVVMLPFIFLLFVLYYLLFTTSGLNFLIDTANSSFKEYVKITADIKEGSVISGFRTDSYFEVYVPGEVIVRADSLDLDYSVKEYLLRNTFVVNTLDAKKLEVELIDSPESEDDTDYGDVRVVFPVKIRVDNLTLKDFAFLSSTVDVRVGEGQLLLAAVDNYAGVTKGHLDNVDVHLKYEGDDSPTEKILPEILSFDNGGGAIEKIHDIDLPLDAGLHSLRLNHARYHMDGYDTGVFNANVNALFSHSLLKVDSIDIEHSLGSFSVSGSMDFVDYYNLDFSVFGSGHASPYNKHHYSGSLYGLSGEGSIKGNLTDLQTEVRLKAPNKINASLRINTLSDEIPVDFKMSSPLIEYPLVDLKGDDLSDSNKYSVIKEIENVKDSLLADIKRDDTKKNTSIALDDQKFYFRDISLNISGAIFKKMEVTLDSSISGYGFENVKQKLAADMTVNGLDIEKLNLEGSLYKSSFDASYSGRVFFGDNLGFSGKVLANASDLKGVAENLAGPAKLSMDLYCYYQDSSKDIIVRTDKAFSSFKLQGKPLLLEVSALEGSLKKGLDVELMSLTLNDNNIKLKGHLNGNSNLVGTVHLPDLSDFSSDIKGNITGQVKVTGNLLRPEISVRGRSDSLKYGSLSVTGLIFDSLTDTAREKGQVSVIVSSIRPYRSSRVYRKCALDLSGTLSAHDLTVSCGAQSGSYLSAHGGYSKNEKTYDARLSSLMLVNNIIEPVTLLEPVSLTYDLNTDTGTVSKIGLTDGQSTLFVENFRISNQGVAADYELSNLNLYDLSKLIPDKTIISGILNSKGSVGYKNSIPSIDAELSMSKGYLRKAQLFIPFESTNATVHTDYKRAELDFKSQLFRELGLIDLTLKIDSPYSERKLDGSLKVKGLNLGVFAPSASSVLNTLKGSSEVDLTFGGTVKKPELYGKVSLKGSAEPSYNLGTVNCFDLSLSANGTTAEVLGKATLNDAAVDITGDLDFSESANGQLRIRAKEVPVFLLNYGESVVNIDLAAGLSESISLTGSLEIPRGLIKFKSIENSAQSPSPDEIFVDEKNSLKKVVKSIKTNEVNSPIAVNVDVSLGDEVKVDAMGLKANVVGGFSIIKKPEDNTLFGNGKLSLVNGRIDMYGHKFVVNKADAIFKGELLDPFFDAEVVADQSTIEDDVLAGVTVKGPSSSPSVRLFSKPAMSQNEILSYLLYGHGLEKNTTSNTDSSSTQLLMTLGLGTTTGILNSVVGIFGMDGVQLGSSGTGDETQVEVQTYVTNRLRLSYGYGVYNSINEFKLRYEIVRKFYAEFISSIDQSVDLIYSFDID